MHSDQRTLFLSGGVQPASLGSVAACGMPSGERALLPSAARAEVTSRPPDGPFLTILVALR